MDVTIKFDNDEIKAMVIERVSAIVTPPVGMEWHVMLTQYGETECTLRKLRNVVKPVPATAASVICDANEEPSF